MGKKRKLSSYQLEIDEKMCTALELLSKKNSGPDIEECMEKLEGLGWEEPLYSAAVGILCEGDSYRKAWMKITEVNKLENWVKVIGKKNGTFFIVSISYEIHYLLCFWNLLVFANL